MRLKQSFACRLRELPAAVRLSWPLLAGQLSLSGQCSLCQLRGFQDHSSASALPPWVFYCLQWTQSGLQRSARAHGDLLCALEHMTGHSQVVGQMRLSGASASAQMDFYSEAIFDSLMHVADGMNLLSADLKDMCCTGSWLPGFQLCMPALCPGVHMRQMRRRCHVS